MKIKIGVKDSCVASGSAFALRACKNLARWGKQNLETLGLAVSEETGELCQAILKERWEKGDRERIREEAVDLGALCMQVIYYLDHPPRAKCNRGDGQLGHSEHCKQNTAAKPPERSASGVSSPR